jgi:hypothetical protein
MQRKTTSDRCIDFDTSSAGGNLGFRSVAIPGYGKAGLVKKGLDKQGIKNRSINSRAGDCCLQAEGECASPLDLLVTAAYWQAFG